MTKKVRYKLKELDIQKIRARFATKTTEFELVALEVLEELSRTGKMSSTDKYALQTIITKKQQDLAIENSKTIENNGNAEGEE